MRGFLCVTESGLVMLSFLSVSGCSAIPWRTFVQYFPWSGGERKLFHECFGLFSWERSKVLSSSACSSWRLHWRLTDPKCQSSCSLALGLIQSLRVGLLHLLFDSCSSKVGDSVHNFCLVWKRSDFASRLIKWASLSFPFPSPIFCLWSLPLSRTADAMLVTSTVLSPVWGSLALPGTPCSGCCRNKKHTDIVCEFLPFRKWADWSGSEGIFLISHLRKAAVMSDVE